jgi:FAD/FMN-containing dehydrogenase
VQVDPVRQRALAHAGATWGDVDPKTQACGLATTGGVISSTGIAGLTLGGGIGWLMGKHGLACDNLISVDVADATENNLTASAEQNADLFWAIRGGGGNFGVVTTFEYHCILWEPSWRGSSSIPDRPPSICCATIEI